MITFTDASDYIFNTIAHDAAGDALLTVTLIRFARHCATLPGAARWLDLFESEFRLERGRRRLSEALRLAKRIED
jgi:hypothetical protein